MKNLKRYIASLVSPLLCAWTFAGLSGAQETVQPNGYGFTTDTHRPVDRPKEVRNAAVTKTLDIIGRGVVYRDDVAKARDEAIADALQHAVEDAVSSIISSTAMLKDFQLLGDRVYNQTDAFVNDYKVLVESKSGRHYRVVVRATVSMKSIREKLQGVGILVTQEGSPTLMFFFSEQNVNEISPARWWVESAGNKRSSVVEKTISDYMRKKGFIVADRGTLGERVMPGKKDTGTDPGDDVVVELGRKFGVDLVIVGKAEAHCSGNVLGQDMKSIQGRFSARAIRTDTGKVIASSEETKTVVRSDETAGGNEVFELSASAAAEDLATQILASWRKDARQLVTVGLVVKGIKEYVDFVNFRSYLKNDVRGVNNAYLRSIKAGEAKIDVDIMGNARLLAEELMSQEFRNFSVNIFEVSEDALKLELVPRGNAVTAGPETGPEAGTAGGGTGVVDR